MNFADNNLNSESAMKISNILKQIKHIQIRPKVLNLSHNAFGDHAAHLLLDNCAGNTNLQYLGLNNVLATEKITQYLNRLLANNSTILCLELDHNYYSDQLFEDLIYNINSKGNNSVLQVLKIGAFKTITGGHVGKFSSLFSLFPKMIVGSGSVRSRLDRGNSTYVQINEINRSLLRVEINSDRRVKEMKNQFSFYEIFCELSLFEFNTKEDLNNMHTTYINDYAEKGRIEMDWRLRKIWEDNLPEAQKPYTKEAIAIEYLLYRI